MSVSETLSKTGFLNFKTSTSTRMGHIGAQKPRENIVFPTSTRMGHVGEQKPCENEVFGNENGDINEDLAFQGV